MKVVSSKDFKLEREVEYGTPEQNQAVKEIVTAIKKEGDTALLRYTEQFDRVTLTPNQLRVTPEELQAAYGRVEESSYPLFKRLQQISGLFMLDRNGIRGWIFSPMARFWDRLFVR